MTNTLGIKSPLRRTCRRPLWRWTALSSDDRDGLSISILNFRGTVNAKPTTQGRASCSEGHKQEIYKCFSDGLQRFGAPPTSGIAVQAHPARCHFHACHYALAPFIRFATLTHIGPHPSLSHPWLSIVRIPCWGVTKGCSGTGRKPSCGAPSSSTRSTRVQRHEARIRPCPPMEGPSEK